MSEVEKLFREILKKLNAKNKGAIIYTGDPDFNGDYSYGRHLRKKVKFLDFMLGEPSKSLPNLATKEQELALQADFYKSYADAGLPQIKKYFTRKAANRNNARRPRKQKPTRDELQAFEAKHVYEQGHSRGWKKAAMREFEITYNTLNVILKPE